jgi:uncharacterized protein (DUF1778 family)
MKTLPRKRPSASAATREKRSARLEARIPAFLKDILLEAAGLSGHASVSSYIVQTLHDSASKTVRQARSARLDASESSSFVRTLLAPAAPVPALQTAFARYREQVR